MLFLKEFNIEILKFENHLKISQLEFLNGNLKNELAEFLKFLNFCKFNFCEDFDWTTPEKNVSVVVYDIVKYFKILLFSLLVLQE